MKFFGYEFDRSRVIYAAIAVLFMGLILFAANTGRSDLTKGSIAITTGDVKSSEEIQAELDAAGLESGVELYMNSNITMLRGNTPANLLIQNSEHNSNNQQVYIYDSESNLIYKSDIIPPGYKIESAKLLFDFDQGVYDCQASFHVLSSDGSDKAVINAPVRISVLS